MQTTWVLIIPVGACHGKMGLFNKLSSSISGVEFLVYVPLTTRSWRRDLGLKSHLKDWRSGESNQRPLSISGDKRSTDKD